MKSIHEEALDRGVHPDCFKAGPVGSCESCNTKIMDIFAERYDNVPTDGVRTKIYLDLMNEKPCELD